MNYDHIKVIVDSWEGFDLSDIPKILEFRRDLSVYHYQISEYKAQQEAAFLTLETDRKNKFNSYKLDAISQGNNISHSITIAESKVINLREKEVKSEREYKKAKDILNSLEQVLNAMSSAVKVGENEKRQSNFHT